MKHVKPLLLLGTFQLAISVLAQTVTTASHPTFLMESAMASSELPGAGKNVVLIATEPEYRSEEMLPQLARLLEKRHGFKCTVVFPLNGKGEVDPNLVDVANVSPLITADLCIIMARFQDWQPTEMNAFVSYVKSGKPIIALRTSTHAFRMGENSRSAHKDWSWDSKAWPGGFGRNILGETWVSHWGKHGAEGTRGTPVGDHVTLTGVESIFVTTDLYEAHPPKDANVLIRGEIVNGLKPTDPLTNDLQRGPMPVAWIMPGPQRVLTTTMGSSLDLLDDSFRRFLVNASFWAAGLERAIRKDLDVRLVEPYTPSMWGFGGHQKGKKPSDF